MEAEYNESGNMQTAYWCYPDQTDEENRSNPVELSWTDGNLTEWKEFRAAGWSSTDTIEYSDKEVGYCGIDFTLYALFEYFASPATLYMGKISAALPSKIITVQDGSSFEEVLSYEFDDSYRVAALIKSNKEGSYREVHRFHYGKQQIPEL